MGDMEFLQNLLNGIQLKDEKFNDELRKSFYSMTAKEQDDTLENISRCIGDDWSDGIYLFSYLLYIIKDAKIIKYINNALMHNNIDALSLINYIYQIGVLTFGNAIDVSNKLFLQTDGIYISAVNDISSHINKEKLAYIPFAERKKGTVLIAARSILAEVHAPTMIVCNIYNYLQKLGYNVIVLIGYMGGVQKDKKNDVYYHAVDNSLVETTQKLQTDHFGLCINVCNIAFTSQFFNQELEMAVDYVRGVNPEFIIDIGGMNIIADVCSRFTTVCSFPCVGTPVHSAAPVIVRRFHCEGEAEKIYDSYLTQDQKVYELMIANELTAVSKISRQNVALRNKKEKDKFILLIVGNRLDREVTDEFLNMLNQILEGEPDVYVEVIGECDKLKNKIKTSDKSDRYIFIGYADNLQEAMADGDLFVNPPRTGGGTGASLALKNHTPIVTLGNCDVAIRGEGFVCGELAQYPEIIKKYIHDAGFMRQQQEYCEHQDKLLNNVDSVGNMKKFCEELRNYIIAEEENNGTYSV